MSNLGAYQWMTTEANKYGGPEQWLSAIKSAAYKKGASDMKNTLVVPVLATGIGLGATGLLAVQKIHKWINDKKQEQLFSEQEAKIAEEYLKQDLQNALNEVESENGGQIE